MKSWSRHLCEIGRGEEGGSVVETAIIVPLFVVIVYWSALFFDFVQLRMKVQEAARFAAWEMTSHDLSGYKHGSSLGASFSHAAHRARHRTEQLYRSLHSENEDEDPHPRLMVTYEWGDVILDNHEVRLVGPAGEALTRGIEGDIKTVVDGLMRGVDDALGHAITHFNFNRYGLISSEVEATVRPRLMPRRFLQAEDGGFYSSRVIEATEWRLTGRAAVVADSWTLHYGYGTSPEGGYEDNPYHRQVQRGHLLGLLEQSGVNRVMEQMNNVRRLLDVVMEIPLPTDAHLASMNYYRGESRADLTRNQLRLPVARKSTQKNFHTQPIQEVCTGFTCAYADSEYSNTLRSRGGWYMGCPEPQHQPGRCQWSTP